MCISLHTYWTSMVQTPLLHLWALQQVPVAGGMSHPYPCSGTTATTHSTDSPKGRHGAEAKTLDG